MAKKTLRGTRSRYKRRKIFLSIIFVAMVTFAAAWLFIPSFRPKVREIRFPEPVRKVIPILPGPPPKTAEKKPPAKISKKAEVAEKQTAKMAIILDDWGRSVERVEEAHSIGIPLTLAVIPHLAYSTEVAEKAHAAGLLVMLHMPMQAKSSHVPEEPQTIHVTSSDDEIRRLIDRALQDVPYVRGMNNHQGSAATSDTRVMESVLKYLKKRNLFFVDSHVIASTVGYKIAGQMDVPFAKRHVFIDNQATVDAVMEKLEEAENYAKKHGEAVVIGHDKKATLEAIRRMAPQMKKRGVQFVLVTELLRT